MLTTNHIRLKKVAAGKSEAGTYFLNTRKIRLNPIQITQLFGFCTACLLLLHCLTLTLGFTEILDQRLVFKLDRIFNFNGEANLPTFFSSFIMLLASGLLYVIYKLSYAPGNKNRVRPWLVLSILFLFFSLDEAIQIHEELNAPIRKLLTGPFADYFYWSWVIPYSVLFLAIGFYTKNLILNLAKKQKKLFIVAGVLFFIGAAGIEVIEGKVFKLYGAHHISIPILYTTQELMEMMGIIIFNHALLNHISLITHNLFIEFNSPAYRP